MVASAIHDTVAYAERAVAAGVDPRSAIIDPAHDFGKNTFHSLEVTRRLGEMVATGWPVLVSLSNKDFVGETLDLPVGERLTGTLAATAVCALAGARIYRVHEVVETRQVVDMVVDHRRSSSPCSRDPRPPVMHSRVVLVPGVVALLPEYAGQQDPVADVRAACLAAVGWLVEATVPTHAVGLLADAQGARIARHLLTQVGYAGHVTAVDPTADSDRLLVVANGSARRSEKAPGHLDDRAAAFDDALGAALRAPDPAALTQIDQALGDELLAANLRGVAQLGARLQVGATTVMDYDHDPFGVQYWVMRWTCGS